MNNTKLVFESKKNSVDILLNDDYISIASIDIMHEDDEIEDCNRNMCHFSHESILKSIPTFYNRPIVYRLNKTISQFATDVTSHAKNEEQAKEMQVGGHIPTDSRIIFRKKDNGKTYCNIEAVIQKRYIPLLMEILKERDGELDVSIEIEPVDAYQDENTGILYINEFKLLGVCLLGEGVEPGMEGSHLEMVTFEKDDDIDTLNKKYIKFSYDKNNIIEKIKYKNMKFEKGGKMEHRELERQLWNILSNKTFKRGKELYHKYYIEAIYDTHIIVRDNEKEEYFKMKYHIDENGNVEVDEASAKPLENDLKRFELSENSFAKEDIGTKEALKVNKKELKDTPWGQIDKAELRKRVIEAKNFKTIAPEVFLDLREGWEEGKMTALKYPVMELDNDTLYYNRGALASAKGYAEKNNEEEVLNKLKKIYESLDLDFEEDNNSDKVMMSCDSENHECENCDKTIENECGDKDKNFEDNKDNDNDTDNDNNDKDKDADNKDKDFEKSTEEVKEPHAGAQEDKDKKDAKDDEGVRQDDVKKEIDMSTDANVDSGAVVEIEKEQAKDNKELSREQNPSLEAVVAEHQELIKKMEGLTAELEDLRKYKKEMEDKERDEIANKLIVEVKDILPTEILDDFIKSVKNYDLTNITEWENVVKAKAFEYSGKIKSSTPAKGYTRMSVWDRVDTLPKERKGQWDF